MVKSCFSADGDFIPADGVGDPPMMIPEAEPVRPEEKLRRIVAVSLFSLLRNLVDID